MTGEVLAGPERVQGQEERLAGDQGRDEPGRGRSVVGPGAAVDGEGEADLVDGAQGALGKDPGRTVVSLPTSSVWGSG